MYQQQPHQSVGQGLLILVEVHEVFIVSCRRKNFECGEHSEQEASGVTCTGYTQTHVSEVHQVLIRKKKLVAEAIDVTGVSWYEYEKEHIFTGN